MQDLGIGRSTRNIARNTLSNQQRVQSVDGCMWVQASIGIGSDPAATATRLLITAIPSGLVCDCQTHGDTMELTSLNKDPTPELIMERWYCAVLGRHTDFRDTPNASAWISDTSFAARNVEVMADEANYLS